MTRVSISPDYAPGPDAANVRQQVHGANRPHAVSSRNLRQKSPWDVRAFIFAWSLLRAPVWHLWNLDLLYGRARASWMPKAAKFLSAHRKGWFFAKAPLEARRASCAGCAFRRKASIGEYCAAQLSTCGCPVSAKYPFSKLTYLIRLRAWACPIGAFGAANEKPAPGARGVANVPPTGQTPPAGRGDRNGHSGGRSDAVQVGVELRRDVQLRNQDAPAAGVVGLEGS